MIPLMLAGVVAAVGTVAASVGLFLAQSVPSDVAPWVSAGGSAAAVGGLVYIAKKLASGDLVAAPVADLLRQSETREKALLGLLDEEKERSDDYRALLISRGGPTVAELRGLIEQRRDEGTIP